MSLRDKLSSQKKHSIQEKILTHLKSKICQSKAPTISEYNQSVTDILSKSLEQYTPEVRAVLADQAKTETYGSYFFCRVKGPRNWNNYHTTIPLSISIIVDAETYKALSELEKPKVNDFDEHGWRYQVYRYLDYIDYMDELKEDWPDLNFDSLEKTTVKQDKYRAEYRIKQLKRIKDSVR